MKWFRVALRPASMLFDLIVLGKPEAWEGSGVKHSSQLPSIVKRLLMLIAIQFRLDFVTSG